MEIPSIGRPYSITAKPIGAKCNLRCKYCYYLEKKDLYPASNSQMSDELLEKFIKEYIESQPVSDVVFVWHGGESLLRPVSFYKKVLKLQSQYRGGKNIINTLQTNGTLLNREWCEFFSSNGWLIGLSIDGPEFIHDAFRKTQNMKGTFKSVMEGIERLNKHKVEWNILATVNSLNGDYPVETYKFFKSLGTPFIQFTPVVERYESNGKLLSGKDEGIVVADFSVNPKQWGHYLISMYDEWVKQDVGTVFVQLFDSTLANWMGMTPGVCTMARTCGNAPAIEFNGDVYSCDHFVFPQYYLGNLKKRSLVEMVLDPRQQRFGFDKSQTLPAQCKKCEYLFACNGECPRNRFVVTADGDPGLNYLCEGYKMFFKHVASDMEFMCRELENKRPPANIMKVKNFN